MAVYVSKPVVVLGEHLISREEVVADMLARHAGHPRMDILPRVLAQMPATRYFSQPWEVVIGERSFQERNETAFADLADMGTRAALGALAAAGLTAGDITAVVTTHSTGDAMPGLDVHLQQALGLRDTVRRRPMTQLGCAGGAHALAMAVEHVTAHPGARVLVVAAESVSSIYHHRDDTIESLIYKALLGDSGAAVVVSGEPLTAGLRIGGVEDTWEYVLPGSQDRYRMRTDGTGAHFGSTRQGPDSVGDMMPALLKWLAEGPGGEPWGLDYVVAHTGGPRILKDLASGLGVGREILRHSWDSLDQESNLSGPSVLRVLERTYHTPPAAGGRGLLVGFGPGFSVTALKTVWQDAPSG